MSLLACQLDPAARSGRSTLLSCTPRDDGRFDLLLDDSVLYAEGGGQPADHGTVGGVTVVDVQKAEGGVRCMALAPVQPGPVQVEVDWSRRLDLMQQHSAQHLVTAVAQDRLGLATVGFHLGDESSTIDLDGALSARDRDRLAAWVNAEIRADRALTHRAVSVDEYASLDVRSRGLPEGHTGPVRLVGIEGLDLNTCGGTHVASTGQLQLVHLSKVERSKGGARLHFLAGGRALAALDAARDRDRALSERLTCPPEDFVASVERLQAQLKDQVRGGKKLLGELAGLLGRELGRGEGVRHLHREEADMGLLGRIGQAAQAVEPDAPLVLTGGEGEGVFLVLGPADWVSQIGPALAAAVRGRGGGRGGRFQGKATALSEAAVAQVLED